ncbi:MAG: adenylyltransferase/cytidyltransferase family protein [Nanoarchaeota archaeon]
MKRVMVFGTFDILHKGHLFFLKEAKKQGYLTVVVARDENVKKIKGRPPREPLAKRIENIKNTGIAEEVMPGYKEDFFKIILEKMPDIICVGYDQRIYGLKHWINQVKLNIEIKRIVPYKEDKYKSSKLGLN